MSSCGILVFLCCVLCSLAQSNDFENENGRLPEAVNYFSKDENKTDARSSEPRLGFPIGYGNDLQGFNGGLGGVYSPLRIDLGGLVLGTVIGLGAVLIVPKILHIFAPPIPAGYAGHGAYARSEDEAAGAAEGSSLGRLMATLEGALVKNKVDSAACLQRAACTFVQSYSSPQTLQLIDAATRNSLVSVMTEGSRLADAVRRGRQREPCAQLYPQCTFNKDGLTAGLQTLMSTNAL